MQQGSIFDELPRFKITKPIRLIELFAGYGSQALALEYLNADFEHYKICEWNYKSCQAYNDIHLRDYTDYSKGISKEKIVEYLFLKGISADWNLPMEIEQIQRLKETKLRKIYNDFIATHNLGSITQCKGSDLEIVDTDKYDYIMTYSFPCQDLSIAGKGAGMEKGSGTRSGLLWEVENILNELNKKPQVLLMENVPQVHSTKNIKLFNDWLNTLEKMGYKSYTKDLNAKHYGIPQSRNRTFVVSILGDYNYEFPEKQELELKLKDMLEDKVDKKYYLSDKMVKYITNPGSGNYVAPISFNGDVACSIVTCPGNHRAGIDNYVKEPVEIYDSYNHKEVDIMGTIPAGYGKVGHGCVIKETIKIKQIGKIYPDSKNFKNKTNGRVYNIDGLSPTLNTGSNDHVPIIDIINTGEKNVGTVTENGLTYVFRRLTPLECFRLMGVKDSDYHKLSETSNTTLYHLAGDSIVVNVLMALFGKVL